MELKEDDVDKKETIDEEIKDEKDIDELSPQLEIEVEEQQTFSNSDAASETTTSPTPPRTTVTTSMDIETDTTPFTTTTTTTPTPIIITTFTTARTTFDTTDTVTNLNEYVDFTLEPEQKEKESNETEESVTTTTLVTESVEKSESSSIFLEPSSTPIFFKFVDITTEASPENTKASTKSPTVVKEITESDKVRETKPGRQKSEKRKVVRKKLKGSRKLKPMDSRNQAMAPSKDEQGNPF